jgi:trehalose 6-phosphate synthase/phosphatase
MSMIVVSNRLPFVLKREQDGILSRHSSAGGLVTAMAPVVKKHNGKWIGWPGLWMEENDVLPEPDSKSTLVSDSLENEQIRAVNIPSELVDPFYNGCCNASYWPLFHSMPDRAVFKRKFWTAYVAVNELFANATFKVLTEHFEKMGRDKAPPLIWIHDYQLMLVPGMLRRLTEENNIVGVKIAFFLHIPFPCWDIFRLFPWDDEILVGLLGCDVIGFHINSYVSNFLDCCINRLGLRADTEHQLIEFDGRSVTIQAFPIGIPFDDFVQMTKKAAPERLVEENVQLVLGVDRLDYTKGIIHRVKAFENLLIEYPEHIEKVVLLQIAVPSRTDVGEYQILKDELDREIGRINGKHSTAHWSPIRYIYRSVQQTELCAYYRDAAVALITPIRDGMNLVAKEYVACQIGEPGVLMLSPFAGAGTTMNEALQVNPLEEHTLADALHRALTMPLDERELRMSALRRREKTNDIHHWVQSFLKASGAFDMDSQFPNFKPLTINNFERWLHNYVGSSSKLALLLDYDGTLAPIALHPDEARLPEETRAVLERLVKMPNVHVAVISGRSIENVKQMVNIEGITYAGNHGLDIEHPDGTVFAHPEQARFLLVIDKLKQDLEVEVCKDGAWIESKGVLLTYHYRNVQQHLRPALIDQATAIVLKHGFRPCKAHCAIEAKPPITWGKGRASIQVLRTTFGVDWSERVRIIYVGDDVTDEDAMKALKGMAVTFRIANSATVSTAADHRLHNTQSVLVLLQWVEKHFSERASAYSSDES